MHWKRIKDSPVFANETYTVRQIRYYTEAFVEISKFRATFPQFGLRCP
ncbi:hypothetical protein T07_12939 [Trichinella nelsoni]|uniref:Uncharacterized protein n=1 Tax=Trichinella nelsoni TaxID=6336 RepID=A0A0V0RMJ9_9BILA|nr:hypothetical protein T07_12939 [Trichinella nelsoni]